jgi:hypothetical protein
MLKRFLIKQSSSSVLVRESLTKQNLFYFVRKQKDSGVGRKKIKQIYNLHDSSEEEMSEETPNKRSVDFSEEEYEEFVENEINPSMTDTDLKNKFSNKRIAKMQGLLYRTVKEEIAHERTNPVDYQGESYSNLMISHKRLLQKQQLRDFTE